MTYKDYKDIVVLIPGWAADFRVFEFLRLKDKYLLPVNYRPSCFGPELLKLMDQNDIGKVSLLGWSLGGFLAADFAAKNPDRVQELALVSIREKYNPDDITGIRVNLEKNKKATLLKFYQACFFAEEQELYAWFKEHLMKAYMRQIELDVLMEGLDYLASAKITADSLKSIEKIKFLHGEEDLIAPYQEALKVKSFYPSARWMSFPKTGHLPFLQKTFAESFDNE